MKNPVESEKLFEIDCKSVFSALEILLLVRFQTPDSYSYYWETLFITNYYSYICTMETGLYSSVFQYLFITNSTYKIH